MMLAIATMITSLQGLVTGKEKKIERIIQWPF